MASPKQIDSQTVLEIIGAYLGSFAIGFVLFLLLGLFIGLGRITK